MTQNGKKFKFTELQDELVGEMVHAAIEKSVRAMGQMLKIRVGAGKIEYGPEEIPEIPELEELGRFKVHLVKMIFKGDINGAFYFIMNDHEVELINTVCLPAELKSDIRSENKMMKHGFMSEIENVIAALCTKEMSEFLGAQMQVQVPEINIMQGDDINEYLFKENRDLKTAFYVKSLLEGQVVNVAPIFLWLVDESFLTILKLNT